MFVDGSKELSNKTYIILRSWYLQKLISILPFHLVYLYIRRGFDQAPFLYRLSRLSHAFKL
ncbi:hypothetical protein CW304_00900 [Bacillus sp. UFRGS-B20]|nr:hypothetical protein CW304_00900 [Bacillus sp. UFRGS-B20]